MLCNNCCWIHIYEWSCERREWESSWWRCQIIGWHRGRLEIESIAFTTVWSTINDIKTKNCQKYLLAKIKKFKWLIGNQGLDIHVFTIGVREVHQNYLSTALLFSWNTAPSSENLYCSCQRRSLPRHSWAPLECMAYTLRL